MLGSRLMAVTRSVACLTCQDLHDGDMKQVQVLAPFGPGGEPFEILPHGNNQSWAVPGNFDENCVATIDFRTKGKPNPPPVNLTMTLWTMMDDASSAKIGLEFTDPSGTLAPATQPLNLWIAPAKMKHNNLHSHGPKQKNCFPQRARRTETVMNDIHDGDMKAVNVNERTEALDIKPYGNSQKWAVTSKFDDNCGASVNFKVPGKPNPPPVPLAATVWGMASIAGADKNAFIFTDPSGTIAPPATMLNIWLPDNGGK